MLAQIRKWLGKGEGGYTLIEQVIAIGLIAFTFTAYLQTLSGTIRGTQTARERTIMLNLARSQWESIQNQSFKIPPAIYSPVSPPAGYSVSVDVTEARSYTYAAPLSSGAPQTVQQITVTVTTDTGQIQVVGYKTRR